MVKVINPFNRIVENSDTSANFTICDCICYKYGDNYDSGRSDSRWTANLVCGCACKDDDDDNHNNNDYKDDSR